MEIRSLDTFLLSFLVTKKLFLEYPLELLKPLQKWFYISFTKKYGIKSTMVSIKDHQQLKNFLDDE